LTVGQLQDGYLAVGIDLEKRGTLHVVDPDHLVVSSRFLEQYLHAHLPGFAGGKEALDHWLEPVTHAAAAMHPLAMPTGTTEKLLIGGAVLLSALGLWVGFRTALGRPILPAREAPPETGFARVLYHKYYVDEIYNALFVRPLVWLSDKVLWRAVDQALVDGLLVNGGVVGSRWLGALGSRIQSGQLGLYVLLFLVGAIWILNTILR